ncbi:MAG: hypothetical protein V4695_02285 [Pseudomonadota bacterium]
MNRLLSLLASLLATMTLIGGAHAQSGAAGAAGYPGNYGFSQPSAGYPGNYGNSGSTGSARNYGNSNNFGVAPPSYATPNRVYVQPLPGPLPGYQQRESRREWQDRDDRANYQRDRRYGHDDRESRRDSRQDTRHRDWHDRNDSRFRDDGRGYPYDQRSSQDVWRR